MNKAVLSNKIYMNKNNDLEKKLLEELTYEFRPSPTARPERICNYTTVNEDICTIPIGRVDLIPKDYEIVDKRNNIQIPFPSFNKNIILRDSQQEILEKVNDNCIINAKPGWGKSFISLAIAHKFKLKTLIAVNTVKLRNQWEEEIKKVFGIYPAVIGSGKFSTDSPITVATVQTLSKEIHKVGRDFGLFLSDEVHHAPTKTMVSILNGVTARYKIGLTGTLGRKDGKHILIPDYISKTVYKPEKENVIDPIILVYESSFSIPGNYMMPWANRVNKLAYNPEYQKAIVNIVNAQVERGHKVLIVSDRIEFLENCSQMTPNSVCITSKVKDQKNLENDIISGKKKALYGSINIFKEGISINELSCLVLASPINNEYMLEQVIARIMRIAKNKKTPEVVDIKLKGNTGENQFKTRLAFYRKEGYKIVSI